MRLAYACLALAAGTSCAGVAQLAEAADLKSAQSGFESQHRQSLTATV